MQQNIKQCSKESKASGTSRLHFLSVHLTFPATYLSLMLLYLLLCCFAVDFQNPAACFVKTSLPGLGRWNEIQEAEEKNGEVRWRKMQATPCKHRIEALSYIVLQYSRVTHPKTHRSA